MKRFLAPLSDRFWLLTLAMTSLGIVGVIAVLSIWWGLPDKSEVLLGSIVTGLLLFNRDIVQTVRAWWTDEKTQKLTDQLGNSSPPGPMEVVTGDKPLDVTETKP